MATEISLVPYSGGKRLLVKPRRGHKTIVSLMPGAQRRHNGFSFPPNLRCFEYISGVLGGAVPTEQVVQWYRERYEREESLLALKTARDAYVDHPSADRLEPYQRVAVSYGLATRTLLNADDCGLGKTCMAIVTVEASGRDKRVLVVCRNPMKWWWSDELRAWSKHAEPKVTILGNSRPERESQMRHYRDGWLIVHWAALRLLPQLRRIGWDWVILDEAHHAKNPKAQRSQAIRKLQARGRLALTATPFTNNASELWGILNFLKPWLYTSYWAFYDMYVKYIDLPHRGRKVTGVRNVGLLRRELAPLMIRRLDSDVRRDSLPVRFKTLRVQMHPEQAKAYRRMAKEALVVLGSRTVEATHVLAQHTRLRQLACSLGVLGPKDVGAKLDALIALIEDAPREKWVVFTTFAEVLDLIEVRLEKADISFVHLRGGMGSTGIRATVKEFQNTPVRVLAGTIQTGGEGLDFTAARQLVFVDQWWDPGVRYHAYKRVARRGQTRSVVITTLECVGTIDETISRMLAHKEAVTATVFASEVRKDLEREYG